MIEKDTPKLAAVVLAAGAARRFGRPKQLERWPSTASLTLVERAVGIVLAAGIENVWVVTGNQQEQVREVLAEVAQVNSKLQFVYNPRWEEGQGYSVAVGVTSVQKMLPEAAGILFMLADQPRIKSTTLEKLTRAFEIETQASSKFLFPVYNGKRGNPVIFGRNFFEELLKLEGDTGGRVVVKKYPQAAVEIEVADPAIHEDVDTPADLTALSEVEVEN